jgi:hypothetical protein
VRGQKVVVGETRYDRRVQGSDFCNAHCRDCPRMSQNSVNGRRFGLLHIQNDPESLNLKICVTKITKISSSVKSLHFPYSAYVRNGVHRNREQVKLGRSIAARQTFYKFFYVHFHSISDAESFRLCDYIKIFCLGL